MASSQDLTKVAPTSSDILLLGMVVNIFLAVHLGTALFIAIITGSATFGRLLPEIKLYPNRYDLILYDILPQNNATEKQYFCLCHYKAVD